MNPNIQFIKTLKGTQELETRKYNLSIESRSTLILIDGKRTVHQLAKLLTNFGDVTELINELHLAGFIEPAGEAPAEPRSIRPVAETQPESRSIPRPSTLGSPPLSVASPDITLSQVKKELAVQIKNSFGLMANPLLNQLEKCNNREAVLSYAIHCRMLIHESSSAKKAEAFWEQVKNLFPK